MVALCHFVIKVYIKNDYYISFSILQLTCSITQESSNRNSATYKYVNWT